MVTLASIFFSEDLICYIVFRTQPYNQLGTVQGQMSKKQQTSPEMIIYRLSELTNLAKEEASHVH